MKRYLLLAAAAAVCATAALADNPHFVRGSGALSDDGGYVASFKEAGLATNANINYVLSAAGSFTFQCYTKSNNTPQGAPNNIFMPHLTTGGTFNSGRNGQVTASLTLAPDTTNVSCQGGGLKLCLNAVSYQSVQLEDVTNSVTIGLPPLSDTYEGASNCAPFSF